MYQLFIEGLQRLGRALMLPIAILPIAGLLLRLGDTDLLNIAIIHDAGQTIFANLALIFAIGIAVGFAKDNNGTAGLAGAIGYLVMVATLKVLDASINMGMLAGIISGLLGGALYNRFKDIKLPEYLAFFGGRRFVPIVTGFSAVGLGVVFGLIWPPIQHGINSFGALLLDSGSFGAFVFGVFNRLLIVTGLHHILNNMAWFVFGNFTDPTTGALVTGDISRYFAGDPKGGQFMTGMFPMMIFGLPAACLAMYRNALPERRKVMGGILLSMALTSALTGVTEPVEFAFMFLAPFLYLVHALLTGLAMGLTNFLNIHLGFTFSGGAIDMALGWGKSTNGWLIFPVGLLYAVIYYTVFDFCIKRFNLKTPGREDTPGSEKVALSNNQRAGAYIRALGGADNLITVGACTTRLRLELADRTKASDSELKALGAMAVVRPGKGGSLQVVVGPLADSIADEIRLAMPDAGKPLEQPGPAAAAFEAPPAESIAPQEAVKWLDAFGGSDNVLQLDCVAMTRLRVQLGDNKALSEYQLKSLGCQGSSQLDNGVWHLLIGEKAASLSQALDTLINRSEVSAKV
ncbi:N-acetylglucosamine-specific PTS transporter subunit IIBC [Pseudomonas chlororaphis]|jgi:PTS system N-acetylglucosamine-specific IIC component|uniref:PTS transporter subunit EIIC n=1 Tax=Pseudomonas chlororaphis subsp. aurantiaca TaxID=86192 RepID=A0AAJ0ZPN1_9PSED|nr:N-acetylglucosamine-specific PTS transporter subunit IIBC [Pseudomonas chlororaphis]AZD52969.1 PTS system, N-acetylglucosamine-specific IIC component [Pseudomonas chlororaphis subsp. aurantiaca]AZD64990.1 PTS system, N-acetylglucosamine-specific IIC component [Pseudomonas chlororaphis subsp. aurantiaca]AZD71462.1 PTS system, N-acetylglucosamine-specific IIC component [Pseudomonas chlororaphis subsp. aurantiaca]MBU4635938.1 PTS transporter subunit EIIC [Pseudomonas chlororaphis subsp. auranti